MSVMELLFTVTHRTNYCATYNIRLFVYIVYLKECQETHADVTFNV
jgi:hypothetical protein